MCSRAWAQTLPVFLSLPHSLTQLEQQRCVTARRKDMRWDGDHTVRVSDVQQLPHPTPPHPIPFTLIPTAEEEVATCARQKNDDECSSGKRTVMT